MGNHNKAPLLPIPENGYVDFTKRIKNISVRYLNEQKPTIEDLDEWIILPLYQEGQDMPLDNDGKSAVLVANIDVMRQIVEAYDKKMNDDKQIGQVLKKKMEDAPLKQATLIYVKPDFIEVNSHLEEGEIADEC